MLRLIISFHTANNMNLIVLLSISHAFFKIFNVGFLYSTKLMYNCMKITYKMVAMPGCLPDGCYTRDSSVMLQFCGGGLSVNRGS